MDVLQAAFNVAEDYRPGGASALAVAIGKNSTTFMHECNGTGGAKLGLLTAVKMTKASRDMRVLLAFAAECGQMCLPLPEAMRGGSDECMQAMSSLSKEFGELCQEVFTSLGDDGEISDNELNRIKREGGELIAQLQAFMVAIEVRHARTRIEQAGA